MLPGLAVVAVQTDRSLHNHRQHTDTHHHHQDEELDLRLGALPEMTFWMAWRNLSEELVLRCHVSWWPRYKPTGHSLHYNHHHNTHTHHHHQDEELDRRLGALPEMTFWMAWRNLLEELVLRGRPSLWCLALRWSRYRSWKTAAMASSCAPSEADTSWNRQPSSSASSPPSASDTWPAGNQPISQAIKQASKQASRQASKQAINQAISQPSKQSTKQAIK